MISTILDKVGKDHPDQAQILSAVLGVAVNKVIDKPVSVGATIKVITFPNIPNDPSVAPLIKKR